MIRLSDYAGISPKSDLQLISRLAERLSSKRFLHINSTKSGGGVAEILSRMTPLLSGLGLNVRWEVIRGDQRFFTITKKIHNSLQGLPEDFTDDMWGYHSAINEENAKTLDLDADVTFVHDPQPVPLIRFRHGGLWIWRCHIDVSNPVESVWDRVSAYAGKYDAAIFSVAKFAKRMPIDEFIITPTIDPLSEKNRDLTGPEVDEVAARFKIPRDKPILLQVSRFDRFKDPNGVIRAYRMVKKYNDCRLVLAGSSATDDPEGDAVTEEVKGFADGDPDIHILLLPTFSDRDINALQRMAAVVLQKSLKEGFGLTVTEAMWKGRPVIGGNVGGIPTQIINGINGFLVNSEEGAAFRVRQILNNHDMAKSIGENARQYVRNHFLITRQIRDYLFVWYAMLNKGSAVMEL
ncbi:MAG: glycosyltransferase [Deltaproteobacteria bacterium]|nr:glycosyltransferase [Deltaproteobacteria bacterium]